MQQPKHYREKVTGAQADRRELNRMLGKLAPGDVVTVTRIDRLARSTFDLFGIVKRIVDAKAQFRSLAEPWADTGTSTGRLMLAVLGGLADVERDLIRTRTAEGRSRAKARGQPMGRPPSQHRVLAPGRAVPDCPQPPVRHRNVALDDALGARSEPQIDIAGNARNALGRAVFARGTHRGDAGNEFGLPERFQLLRTVGAIHLARL